MFFKGIFKYRSDTYKMNSKRLTAIILTVFIFPVIFAGCAGHTINEEYGLIRIHIRANSNSEQDQAVKLKVRDKVNKYLERELDGVTDFTAAYSLLEKCLETVIMLADLTLKENGFGYTSRARLNEEFFPTRSYEDVVVESGYYDALIIELGEGSGDNWWCVIYPPLCYIKADGGGDVVYKSKIKELFDKFFGK